MTSAISYQRTMGHDYAGWQRKIAKPGVSDDLKALWQSYAEKAQQSGQRVDYYGNVIVEEAAAVRPMKEQQKPATVKSVADNEAPNEQVSAITEATPELSTVQGEASAYSSESATPSGVTPIHNNPNKHTLVNQDTQVNFLIPNSYRRLSPVASRPGWLCFNISTSDLVMLKWYSVASLGIEEAQQESTPETVEPVQPTPARHAAIDCGEVCLRAAIDAILDGNYDGLRDAFEEFQHSRIRYAGHGMNGLRTVYVSTIKRAVVKPEELIEVDENAGIAPGQLPLLPAGESEAA